MRPINSNVAIRIVKTGKLTVEQMLEISDKVNDSGVWQAVVEQIEQIKL